jgi:replicative superfamily II helicase
VRIERDRAEAEQRARLMAQAQDASHRRDWDAALNLANLIIERYPHSLEAEGLRQQLPTLRENAEILARQKLEARYIDLVKAHRYAEALQIAREVASAYPYSVQAERLREQIPQLETKLAGPTGRGW